MGRRIWESEGRVLSGEDVGCYNAKSHRLFTRAPSGFLILMEKTIYFIALDLRLLSLLPLTLSICANSEWMRRRFLLQLPTVRKNATKCCLGLIKNVAPLITF